MMLDIGANIKMFRTANNLSQEDLADKLHVSRQTISKWELNKSTPNLEYLLQLKEIFAITFDQLLADTIIKENSMKKAILFVHNYRTQEIPGHNYKPVLDYATGDLIENITKIYPEYDWRPAKRTEINDILLNEAIDLVLITPVMKSYLSDVKEVYSGEVRVMRSDEYGKITKPPFGKI